MQEREKESEREREREREIKRESQGESESERIYTKYIFTCIFRYIYICTISYQRKSAARWPQRR